MLRLILVIVISIGIGPFASASPRPNEEHNIQDRDLQTNSNKLNDEAANDIATATSNRSLEEHIENYLKNHDVSFKLPFSDSTVIMNSRNLDSGDLDFKIDFSSDSEVQARKKSKIKKVFIPLFIFILLKAIVLIPLAVGILGIKTWNAIQLSFVSFVSTVALAVWKLCTKINQDHPPAIIHSAWSPHDRSDTPQQMAYSSYAPL